MIDVFAPLALVGLAGFVVAFVWAARKQRRERAQLFREVASAHGWRFLETDDGPARELSAGFAEFADFRSASLGERPPASVVVCEVDVGRICLFSHATRRHEGDARQWTLCIVEVPRALGPAMRIRPRSLKTPRRLLRDPEVATGDARFDEAFQVRSPDPAAANDALDSDVGASPLHPRSSRLPFSVEVQTRGRRIAVYPAGRNEGPETVAQLEGLLEQARELARRLGAPDG